MNNDCQFWWNWWVNFGIGIATFLAVLVALFGDKLKFRIFRAKLKITLRNQVGEKTKIISTTTNTSVGVVQQQPSVDARYYHLRISNNTKWQSSNQTQVFLQRVEEPGPNGKLQVKWDGEVPMEWMHQSIYPLARTIGPDAICDLCCVVRGSYLQLLPVISPNSLRTHYGTNSVVVLTLQAKGNEGESPISRIKISWDGNWNDEDTAMAKHLIIKDVTEE